MFANNYEVHSTWSIVDESAAQDLVQLCDALIGESFSHLLPFGAGKADAFQRLTNDLSESILSLSAERGAAILHLLETGRILYDHFVDFSFVGANHEEEHVHSDDYALPSELNVVVHPDAHVLRSVFNHRTHCAEWGRRLHCICSLLRHFPHAYIKICDTFDRCVCIGLLENQSLGCVVDDDVLSIWHNCERFWRLTSHLMVLFYFILYNELLRKNR